MINKFFVLIASILFAQHLYADELSELKRQGQNTVEEIRNIHLLNMDIKSTEQLLSMYFINLKNPLNIEAMEKPVTAANLKFSASVEKLLNENANPNSSDFKKINTVITSINDNSFNSLTASFQLKSELTTYIKYLDIIERDLNFFKNDISNRMKISSFSRDELGQLQKVANSIDKWTDLVRERRKNISALNNDGDALIRKYQASKIQKWIAAYNVYAKANLSQTISDIDSLFKTEKLVSQSLNAQNCLNRAEFSEPIFKYYIYSQANSIIEHCLSVARTVEYSLANEKSLNNESRVIVENRIKPVLLSLSKLQSETKVNGWAGMAEKQIETMKLASSIPNLSRACIESTKNFSQLTMTSEDIYIKHSVQFKKLYDKCLMINEGAKWSSL